MRQQQQDFFLCLLVVVLPFLTRCVAFFPIGSVRLLTSSWRGTAVVRLSKKFVEQDCRDWIRGYLGLTDKETDLLPLYLADDEENIKARLNFLQERLGISNNRERAKNIILRCPPILTYEVEMLDAKLNWLQDRPLSFRNNDLVYFLSNSQAIGRPTEEWKMKLEWLQTTFAWTDVQLSGAVRKAPGILSYRIESLSTKAEWLLTNLGLDDSSKDKLGTIVSKDPLILFCSIEKMTMNRDFLQQELELNFNQTAAMLRQRVTLLRLSLKDTLAPKLEWVNNTFGGEHGSIRTKQDLGKMIRRCTTLFTHKVETTLEPRLDYLMETFHLVLDNDDDKKSFSDLVVANPFLLSITPQNMETKIQFVMDWVGGNNRTKALEVILTIPSVLSRSLNNRLKPRNEEICELGLSGLVPLSTVCVYTNEQWDAYIERKMAKKMLKEQISTLAS